MTVTLCALAVCAALVCGVTYGVCHILAGKDSGDSSHTAAGEEQVSSGSTDGTREKGQEDTGEESAQDAGGGQQEAGGTGTTVSILGDSISTFKEYIPAGYYDFFPENGQVSDVEDTWWKQVIDDKGWTLYVNGSSSGAACVGDSTGTDNPQCGCNEFRTGGLYGPGGEAPDVILVYMGTNDLLQSIPMGDNDGTGQRRYWLGWRRRR